MGEPTVSEIAKTPEPSRPPITSQESVQDSNKPPEGPAVERSEKGKVFREYLEGRMEKSNLTQASFFAKDLTPERKNEYAFQVETAYLEIVDKLGLDETILQDERYKEAFLALSDSWAGLTSKGGDEAEKTFLLQFGRVLAGGKSKLNQDAFAAGEPGAGKYLEIDGADEKEKARADFIKYRGLINPDKSRELLDKMKETGPDSLLAFTKGSLSIDPAAEKPYRVMVLKTYNSPYAKKEGQVLWRDVVSTNAAAFVSHDPDDDVPTIVMSEETYDGLSDEDEMYRKSNISTLSHEYAHTQRQIRMGNETNLGRIFDERMVIDASKGVESHLDTAAVFLTLNRLMPEGSINLRKTLLESVASDKQMAEFLAQISDNFGLRSTLLLLAVQPKHYQDSYGIDVIPGIKMDPNERMSDLVNQLIEERAKIDPTAPTRLAQFYNRLSREDADMERFLFNYAKVRMPPEYQTVLEQKAA